MKYITWDQFKEVNQFRQKTENSDKDCWRCVYFDKISSSSGKKLCRHKSLRKAQTTTSTNVCNLFDRKDGMW